LSFSDPFATHEPAVQSAVRIQPGVFDLEYFVEIAGAPVRPAGHRLVHGDENATLLQRSQYSAVRGLVGSYLPGSANRPCRSAAYALKATVDYSPGSDVTAAYAGRTCQRSDGCTRSPTGLEQLCGIEPVGGENVARLK
jgi:hypothetical protein